MHAGFRARRGIWLGAVQTQHPIEPACTCVTLLVRFALSVLTVLIIELIVVNKEVWPMSSGLRKATSSNLKTSPKNRGIRLSLFCWPFGKYVYLCSCRKFDTTRMPEERWQSSHVMYQSTSIVFDTEMFNFDTILWTISTLNTSLVHCVLHTKNPCETILSRCGEILLFCSGEVRAQL